MRQGQYERRKVRFPLKTYTFPQHQTNPVSKPKQKAWQLTNRIWDSGQHGFRMHLEALPRDLSLAYYVIYGENGAHSTK